MRKLILAIALAVTPIGCAHTASAPTPSIVGAVNAFDSTSYVSLMAAQASLQSLRSSIVNDPNLVSLKPVVNQAIADYNLADIAYQAYHAAALAGVATSTQQTAVTTSLTAVQTDLKKAGQ